MSLPSHGRSCDSPFGASRGSTIATDRRSFRADAETSTDRASSRTVPSLHLPPTPTRRALLRSGRGAGFSRRPLRFPLAPEWTEHSREWCHVEGVWKSRCRSSGMFGYRLEGRGTRTFGVSRDDHPTHAGAVCALGGPQRSHRTDWRCGPRRPCRRPSRARTPWGPRRRASRCCGASTSRRPSSASSIGTGSSSR